MLLKSTLGTTQLCSIINNVSTTRYARNLIGDVPDYPHVMRDGRKQIRFTLAVRDSYGAGARTSANGRHMPKASWQAHRDVMRCIFDQDPDAVLKTALATYHGRADFERKFEETGDRNVGSMMEPAKLRDTAV